MADSLLHRFQQIGRFQLLDRHIGIPRHPEWMRLDDCHPWEEYIKIGSDQLFQPHKIMIMGHRAIFAHPARGAFDRHQARQRVGDLDARKMLPAFFIPDQDRQIQA